jgi:hypothetical protein
VRVTALALSLCLSAPAAAQGVMVGAQVVYADHYLAGEPLTGISARVSVPLQYMRGTLYVRFGQGRSSSERFGRPCGGFTAPGACSMQVVDDQARMTSLGLGLSYALVKRSRYDVGVDLDGGGARWTATSRGRTTGETGTAAEAHIGGSIGLHTAFTPARRVPLAIEAGAALDATTKMPGYSVEDAWTPFAESITQVRYYLGIAWRR